MTDALDADASTTKQMRLRYAGTCRHCGTTLSAGDIAIHDRAAKAVQCVSCSPDSQSAGDKPAWGDQDAADVESSGQAGVSVRREYERRRANREDRVRAAHPKLGGLILALSDEPQCTTAWATGAVGEELLGKRLDALTERGVRVLHDRRVPRSTANIDHIAIGPAGVFVVDAKRYKGRPRLAIEGGILRPRVEKLIVGTRDQTKLVDGVRKQVEVVRGALQDAGISDVPVRGVLCFVDADWPLIGGAFVIRGVDVLWPKKLAQMLLAPDGLEGARIDAVHRALATRLSAA